MTRYEKLQEQPLGVVAGSLLVVVGAALPWGRQGQRDRSCFELVQFADRNELLEGAAAGLAKVWLLAPLALAVVVVAAAMGRRWVAAAVGAGVATFAVGLAVALERSPLERRFGLGVSLAGVVLVAADAIRQAVRR